MARPREFDETAVLDATVQCFWSRGYEATSVKDLIQGTGITAASLYNAYGDKRGLFRAALDHYVEHGIMERIRRCEALPPRQAIGSFFDEILSRSLNDNEHKGCMLVNQPWKSRHMIANSRGASLTCSLASKRFSSIASTQVRPTEPSPCRSPRKSSPGISSAC